MLNLVKEALDEITLAIEREIAFALTFAIGLGRNDRSHSLVRKLVDERIGIIRLIGDDGAWVGIFEQWFSATTVLRSRRPTTQRNGSV